MSAEEIRTLGARLKRHLGWIMTLLGLGVIAWFVHRLGVPALLKAFRTMGWGLAVLLALPIFLFFVHAVGWSFTMSAANRRKIGLFRLTLLQAFSYGVSGMVPAQIFVSEPLKLVFLKGADYDKEDFAASLVTDNTINTVSIFVVAAAGLVYLALFIVEGLLVKLLVAGLIAGSFALFAGLILLQKKGLLTGLLNLLTRLPPLTRICEQNREKVERVDANVRKFYVENRRGFYLSLACHILEKAQGVAEFWVIFYILGMEVSWGACFFIFAVVSTLDNLLFFAQVGGMEAWVASLLSWMSITRDSINITAALFRRVRFLFWALVALAMVGPLKRVFRR